MANQIYELDLNFDHFVNDQLWHIEDAEIDWKKRELRVRITINDQFGTLFLYQSFINDDFYRFVNSNQYERIIFLKQTA